MKTILSILRFPFSPSSETRALIERGISWEEIIIVLFSEAILLQVFYEIFRAANLYFMGYEFSIDFNIGFLIIFTVLGILVFPVPLFIFCKLFGGKGSFKNHMGIFLWMNVPISIAIGVAFSFWHSNFLNFNFPIITGLIMCIAFGWSVILILNSYSIVHKFSKTRAALTFIIPTCVLLIVGFIIWMIILGSALRMAG